MKKLCPSIFILILFFVALFFPSKAFALDIVPPITTYTISPTEPNGENGWYIDPVSITINSSDLESGVAEMNWKLNTGGWNKKTYSQTLNRIANPSFEVDTSGWEFVPSGSVVGQRTGLQYKFGLYSINISSLINGVSYWHNRSSYVVAQPWQNINVGVWLKGTNIIGTGAYYSVYVMTNTGDLLLYTSPALTGTFDWTYLSKDLTISSDYAYGVYVKIFLDGVGEAFYDGVYVANSSESPIINLNFSDNGNNTFQFYAVDFAGNIEATQSRNFKVDLVSPTNWENFETQEAGNNHTLISSIDVSDNASGLNESSAKFQYSVINTFLWGYFSNLLSCASPFVLNGWVDTTNNFANEDLTGTLETPAVDYCNSNWILCKGLRFSIKDMAGNETVRQMCIKGPWVKSTAGDIHSNGSIGMVTAAPENNSRGVISANGSISNFDSSYGWSLPMYSSNIDLASSDYTYLRNKLNPTTSVTQLPTTNGVFTTSGDFYVSNSTIPNDYATSAFYNVLFIPGDLVFNADLSSQASAGTVFVVRDDVLVSRVAEQIAGGFLVNGTFDTSYNGGINVRPLTVNGFVKANNMQFSRGTFPQMSTEDPSEIFNYEPKYILNFQNLLGIQHIYWKEIYN